MKRPGFRFALEANRRVRGDDEWCEEPDELDRVTKALESIHALDDPVTAAAVLAFRISKPKRFAEGTQGNRETRSTGSLLVAGRPLFSDRTRSEGRRVSGSGEVTHGAQQSAADPV